MMDTFFFAVWFFLPAGIANMTPVLANKVPRLNEWDTPMDFGKSFRGKRIFGDHKRWRGVVSGVVVASIIVLIEYSLYQHSAGIRSLVTELDYGIPEVLWLGPLLGAGALFGDAIKSFFKRRVGVKPGHSWFPFDQSDYIVGGLLASLIIVRLNVLTYLFIFATWFALHLIASFIAFQLGLKLKPI